mmetsp:Transcript_2591/g.4949  ORF Transcript_2591/g.4949 Transcript_2591/m.4949 type:complete len:429 (-) Transcript_2591:206-1492(-)
MEEEMAEALSNLQVLKERELQEADERLKELINQSEEKVQALNTSEELIQKYEKNLTSMGTTIIELKSSLETSMQESVKSKDYLKELKNKIVEIDEDLKKESKAHQDTLANFVLKISKLEENKVKEIADLQEEKKKELREAEEKSKELENVIKEQSKILQRKEEIIEKYEITIATTESKITQLREELRTSQTEYEEEMCSTLAGFQAVKRELQESEEKMKDLKAMFEKQSKELCSKDDIIDNYMKERRSLSKIAKLGLNLAGDKTKDSAQTIAKQGKNLGRQASSRGSNLGRNLAREARSRSRSLSRGASSRGKEMADVARSRSRGVVSDASAKAKALADEARGLYVQFKGIGQVFDNVENRETDESKEITQESNVSNDESQENATIAEEPKNSKVVEVQSRFHLKSFMKTKLKTKKNNVAEQAEVSAE